MRFGTSYYPEITPEAEWERDLLNMRAARLTVIRAGEFAWSAIEPREGCHDFGWLDRFVDLAHRTGFGLVLCTPTATPPAWLTTQYPSTLIERRDGTRHVPGGRRDVDVDDEVFQHYSVEIATALGRRYGQHPAVVGWQIDNELIGPEGEPPESHSPATVFRFRQYLKRVHGDLATLNARWGTRFWGQEYSDWGEVGTPRNARSTMGHVLDYSRYFSDSQQAFLGLQYRALRGVIAPAQWVSHNSTAVFDRGLDHADWARSLDVAGWDAYFGAAGRPHPEAFAAMAHDLFRAAKHKPFWAFETNAIDARSTPAFLAEMHARGAEAVVLWHWRGHRANAEQDTDTFCDHAGRPHDDRVDFLRKLCDRPEFAVPAPDARAPRRAALLFCPDCVRTALTPDPYIRRSQAAQVPYLRVLIETYRALWLNGIAVDVVQPGQALDGYALLVAPSARLLSAAAIEGVRAFVSGGGTLLAVAKTAHQDEWGTYHPSPARPLEDVLGFTIRRDVRLSDEQQVRTAAGELFACLPHAEQVTPSPAAVVTAWFAGGPLDGAPAALTHPFGRGRAVYVAGCAPGLIRAEAARAAAAAGVPCAAHPFDDVAILPDQATDFAWLFNHGPAARTVGATTIAAGDFARVPLAAIATPRPHDAGRPNPSPANA